MKTYKANIRVPKLGITEVRIKAQNLLFARGLLEAQYGKGSIHTGPIETK